MSLASVRGQRCLRHLATYSPVAAYPCGTQVKQIELSRGIGWTRTEPARMAWIAPLFYSIFAALALLLPESRFPEVEYYYRAHDRAYPLENVVALISLWVLALIPWIAVVARRKVKTPLPLLIIPIAVVALTAISVRPPFTHDVFIYACQGRLLVALGVSPYKVAPLAFLNDPVLGALSRTWAHMTAVFGPLAILIYGLANFLAPSAGLHGLGKLLKGFWLIPYALLFQKFWQRWSEVPQREALMLAVFANPAMLVYVFAEGHVDVVFLFFLILAGLALESRQPAKAALALCASAAIKMSSMVMFPACACWLWSRDRKKALIFSGTFLLSYGICSALINAGDLRAFLNFTESFFDPSKLQVVPKLLATLGVQGLPALKLGSDLVFFAIIGLLCLTNLRGKGWNSPFLGMALSAAALYFTRTYTQGWYTLWFFPLLWFTMKRPRDIYLSVGLWTVSILLYLIYWHTFLYNHWVCLLGFLVTLRQLPADAKPAE